MFCGLRGYTAFTETAEPEEGTTARWARWSVSMRARSISSRAMGDLVARIDRQAARSGGYIRAALGIKCDGQGRQERAPMKRAPDPRGRQPIASAVHGPKSSGRLL